MDEDSQVLRKRYLFNLADKITRYANHWLFMKICLRCNITPNGLKLKKTPQIGKTSENFLSQWNAIMFRAEINLVETLVSEYRTQTLVLQVEFWNKVTEYLEVAAEIGEARSLIVELCGRIEQAERGILVRRRRKLSRLNVGDEALAVEEDFLANFTFIKDLKSFWDAEHHAEGGELHMEQAQVIDLDEIQRELMQNNFDNQPPTIQERGSRTFGESTSQQEVSENNHEEIQYEVKRDENGRIEGQFVNNKVINLSQRTLSQHEISVLSKGLKFVATPKEIDYSQVKIDLENFGRRLRLKWYFKENEDFSEVPAFRPKSKFNPRNKDVAIEVFLSKLEDELMKISPEGCNYSNLTREEKVALNNLRSDHTIIIKEADKGSGVVVWDREDYILEAENQLRDPGVYQKLDNDPSTLVQRVINDAISNIEERGDIDEKTLEYFMVNNPKLGRFYLLPKIHKRLSSVPGRPVISNSGCFTVNISAFLDHYLQPLAKKSVRMSKILTIFYKSLPT